MTDKAICSECEYVQKNNFKFDYTQWLCNKIIKFNYVAGVNEATLCVEANPDGNCKHFKRKEKQWDR